MCTLLMLTGQGHLCFQNKVSMEVLELKVLSSQGYQLDEWFLPQVEACKLVHSKSWYSRWGMRFYFKVAAESFPSWYTIREPPHEVLTCIYSLKKKCPTFILPNFCNILYMLIIKVSYFLYDFHEQHVSRWHTSALSQVISFTVFFPLKKLCVNW